MGILLDLTGIDGPARSEILKAFMYVHPMDKQFPRDSKVQFTISEYELVEHLIHEQGYQRTEAIGIARTLFSEPPVVDSVQDLADSDGCIKPYIAVYDYIGCIYCFPIEFVRHIE